MSAEHLEKAIDAKILNLKYEVGSKQAAFDHEKSRAREFADKHHAKGFVRYVMIMLFELRYNKKKMESMKVELKQVKDQLALLESIKEMAAHEA